MLRGWRYKEVAAATRGLRSRFAHRSFKTTLCPGARTRPSAWDDSRQIEADPSAGDGKIVVPRHESELWGFERERRSQMDGVVPPEAVLFGEIPCRSHEIWRHLDVIELFESSIESALSVFQPFPGQAAGSVTSRERGPRLRV